MRDALAMLRGRTVDAPQLAPAVAAALARVVSGGAAQLRREKRHGEAAEALREAVAADALPHAWRAEAWVQQLRKCTPPAARWRRSSCAGRRTPPTAGCRAAAATSCASARRRCWRCAGCSSSWRCRRGGGRSRGSPRRRARASAACRGWSEKAAAGSTRRAARWRWRASRSARTLRMGSGRAGTWRMLCSRCCLGWCAGRRCSRKAKDALARASPTRRRPVRQQEVPRAARGRVDGVLERLRGGGAAEALAEGFARHRGGVAVGVDWERFELPWLQRVARALGGEVVAAAVNAYASDYATFSHSAPDLLRITDGRRARRGRGAQRPAERQPGGVDRRARARGRRGGGVPGGAGVVLFGYGSSAHSLTLHEPVEPRSADNDLAHIHQHCMRVFRRTVPWYHGSLQQVQLGLVLTGM